jgi:hypothetical protein
MCVPSSGRMADRPYREGGRACASGPERPDQAGRTGRLSEHDERVDGRASAQSHGFCAIREELEPSRRSTLRHARRLPAAGSDDVIYPSADDLAVIVGSHG